MATPEENDAYDVKKNFLIMNIKPDASTETFKFDNEVVYTTYINFLLERMERVRSATLTRMGIGSKSGETTRSLLMTSSLLVRTSHIP